MNPFDGCSPVSGCNGQLFYPPHKSGSCFVMLELLLIFLPPYNPDINPIELAFGYVKAYLKEHQDLLGFINHTHSSCYIQWFHRRTV